MPDHYTEDAEWKQLSVHSRNLLAVNSALMGIYHNAIAAELLTTEELDCLHDMRNRLQIESDVTRVLLNRIRRNYDGS